MAYKLSPATIHLEHAADVAATLADRFEEQTSLRAAWEKHASPEAREKLKREKANVCASLIDAIAAGTGAEMEKSMTAGFNATIRAAETLVATVGKHDPEVDVALDAYFAGLKNNPRHNADYSKAFEDAGAPTLAAASRKANAVKPEAPKP
jgi:hypothetical protein